MRKILLLFFVISIITSQAQEVKDTTRINNGSSSMNTITLSSSEVEEEGEIEDVSSLLQGSKDVFINTAGYTFGAARFKIRGYDSENTEVFLSGIPMNDVEGGRVYYGIWGGLNDVMRNKQFVNGIDKSEFTFGGVGGATNISTRASEYRKGTSASYANSNRSYRNRLMITHSTGLMKNGFALTASASKRWAQEGYSKGTSYDGYAYFLSVEKKFNKRHSLGLTVFGSPTKRGKAGGSTQEAYNLLDDNYYNPNWGYQNGEVRNSKVSNSHKPQIILTHYHKPTEETTVTTSVGYGFGSYSTTALDWYNTRDPRPDYYRYLPSYYDDPSASSAVEQEFKNNHQLDWDYFYGINKNNENGRSSYIVENRVTDYTDINANMVINHKLNDIINIDGGFAFNKYKGHHYKTVNDLLGGEYYLDIDKFAERDYPNDLDMIDNDLTNPDKVRKVGDVLGYDYDMNKIKYNGWAQASIKLAKLDAFASFNMSHTSFWRTGYMRNGKFPDDSYGDSKKQKFLNYGIKAGATYKLNGRNYFYAQGYYGTRAPFIRNSYISPRTRDFTVDGLDSETIFSIDGGYNLRAPRIKARISLYYTEFKNQTQVYSFYNDLYHSYTNQILSGIDKQNMGVEIGLEGKITSTLSATAVAAIGQNIYTNRPTGIAIQDNDATQLSEPTTIYQKNFYQANGPQNAYSVGLSYRNPHYWFVNINANLFTNSYLQFNPARRTTEAVANEDGTAAIEPGSEEWNKIIDQEKIENAFTIDLFGGKSWKIKDKYYIYFNTGINNILNNKKFKTGGYEQRRFDYTNRNVDKFPPKYFYGYGINYFVSVGIRI